MGAAIAAGSQAEKGNWALFEQAAMSRSKREIKLSSLFILKFQLEFIIVTLIASRIIMSPTRLLRIVIEPEALDE